MIPVGPATRIFLATGSTDMRKSFEGLSDLVRSRLKGDPRSGHLFVFANRRRTRLKPSILMEAGFGFAQNAWSES